MRSDIPFRPASLPFFYGWVVLVVTTLGVLCSIPGQTMGVSVFADPLMDATGLSRLAFSNAYLVGTVASALALSLGGSWLDRLGARLTVLAACLGVAATLVFLSYSDRLAAGVAAGLGIAERAPVAWTLVSLGFASLRFSGQGMLTLVSRTTLARWFDRRRGLVSALSGAFVNFGFAAAPLGLALWIDAAGWRGAWHGMAACVGIGMGLVGFVFYRNDPEECGLHPDGSPPPTDEHIRDASEFERPIVSRDFTRPEAMRTAAFWLVTLGISIHAMVGTGLTFHIVDLGAEAGLTKARAVAIFLPIALISTSAGFLVGTAIDRFPIRFTIAAMMIFEIAMYAGMAFWSEPALRWIAIAGWGLSSGCYGPLTIAALPALFGRRHLGAIQGAQMTALVLASALGPALLAGLQDVAGSYRPGLLGLCLLPALVAVAAPFTRTPDWPTESLP